MATETLQGYATQINDETNRIAALLQSKEAALAAAATVEEVHAVLGPVLEPLKALGRTTDPVPVPEPEPPVEPPVEGGRRGR